MSWRPGQGGTQHRGPSKPLPEWTGLVILLACFGAAISFLILIGSPWWAVALAIYVSVGGLFRWRFGG